MRWQFLPGGVVDLLDEVKGIKRYTNSRTLPAGRTKK